MKKKPLGGGLVDNLFDLLDVFLLKILFVG